ncbi:hypothetical protein F5876DRAFT_39717 [Lentinula aff. lateritia]|uniref:Uncharacterized protein n=1 Tax=Lentinula aff. lateritia TaxID=2804960 RepID=A0ACC1U2Y6_9AGAR|nr:hypothetical protein F5876DRAFT_39717 [Lentinula aff. lateritia]
MTPITDRASLEAMKRADLQKLCKDHGLRANLKSEALIDLLLDAQQGTKQQPGQRSVSTRMSSRSTRTSSMIVHDVEGDEEGPVGGAEEEEKMQPGVQEVPPSPPPPRIRKAKETQFRLGVGRPLAAGGKGARAVTKSVSASKAKKGKGSRSAKPSEATIEEEPESETIEPHRAGQPEPKFPQTSPPNLPSVPAMSTEIDTHVMEALKPLYEQLKSLKAELQQMQSLRNELMQLRNQTADIDVWKQKVDTLSSEVEDLRKKAALADSLNTELRELKELISTQRASSPISEEAASGYRTPIMTRTTMPNALSIPRAPALMSEPQPSTSNNANYSSHPGIAPVMLGKRHRDSTGSHVAGVVEQGQGTSLSEADLAKTVLRPDKKRVKLSAGPDADGEDGSPRSPEENGEALRGPSFTVFSGPELDDSYVDPPPPTTPLPAFYTASTPPNNNAGPSRPRVTSTQDASENLPPFSFSFLPVPPTPGVGNPYPMPSFLYPEPPQSPTPVRDSNPTAFISNNRNRTDVFQAFGLPPPTRPRSRLEPALRTSSQDSEMGQYLNPAAFDNREGDESAPRSEDSSDAMKRTMYGTELEVETRFGDFGLEGVASDYKWSGSYI